MLGLLNVKVAFVSVEDDKERGLDNKPSQIQRVLYSHLLKIIYNYYNIIGSIQRTYMLKI